MTDLASLRARIEELERALDKADAALKPLADAVYNDNRDMTVSATLITSEQCITAYFAERNIRRARTAHKGGDNG